MIVNRDRFSKLSEYFIVFCLYSFIAILFSYPLITRLNTHIPGVGGDAYQFYWGIWWIHHSIFEMGESPYYTDLLFYPYGVSLTFHTLSIFNGMAAAPLVAGGGTTIAFNIVFLLMFPVSGIGMYLLCYHICCDRKAAFVGSLVFVFSPFRLVRSEAHLNIFSIQWLPFFILFLLKSFAEAKRRVIYIFAGAAAFAANALSCWYYMIYSILIAGYLTLADLCKRKSVKFWIKPVIITFSTVTAGLFIMLPVLLPVAADLSQESNYLYAGNSEKYSIDLLSYLLPSHLHPFLGNAARRIAGPAGTFHGNRCEGMAAIGYAALFFALLGIVKKRNSIKWAVLALIGLIFSLGPVLHIGGYKYTSIPMPYRIIQVIPIINGARVPGRFAVILTLSLSILVSQGISYSLKLTAYRPKSLIKKAAAPFFAVLILFEYLPVPLSTCSTCVPELLKKIRDDNECRAVIEWPVGPFRAMMRQTFHLKPIMDAKISRIRTSASKARALKEKIERMIVSSTEKDVFSPISRFGLAAFYGIDYLTLDLHYLKQDITSEREQIELKKRISRLFGEPPTWADDEIEIYAITSPSPAFLPPLEENGWSLPYLVGEELCRSLIKNTGFLEIVVTEPVKNLILKILYDSSQKNPATWYLNDVKIPITPKITEAGKQIVEFNITEVDSGIQILSVHPKSKDNFKLFSAELSLEY